jgi:hypothetical protein
MGCIKIFISTATALPAAVSAAPAPGCPDDLPAAPLTAKHVFLPILSAAHMPFIQAFTSFFHSSHPPALNNSGLIGMTAPLFGICIILLEHMFWQEEN